MKKGNLIVIILTLVLAVSGCGSREKVPEAGDFSFTLPRGFTISDVTEKSCAIVDAEGTVVGGFLFTDLTPGELWDDDSDALFRYFNEVAYGCEYFGWKGGDKENPLRYVSLSFTEPETEKKRQTERVLFVSEGGVYDMWFDTERIGEGKISEFYPIAEDG